MNKQRLPLPKKIISSGISSWCDPNGPKLVRMDMSITKNLSNEAWRKRMDMSVTKNLSNEAWRKHIEMRGSTHSQPKFRLGMCLRGRRPCLDDARVYHQFVGTPNAECHSKRCFFHKSDSRIYMNYRRIGSELSPLSLLSAILQSKILPCVPNFTVWLSNTRFHISDSI
jgi:hypothetical protein